MQCSIAWWESRTYVSISTVGVSPYHHGTLTWPIERNSKYNFVTIKIANKPQKDISSQDGILWYIDYWYATIVGEYYEMKRKLWNVDGQYIAYNALMREFRREISRYRWVDTFYCLYIVCIMFSYFSMYGKMNFPRSVNGGKE